MSLNVLLHALQYPFASQADGSLSNQQKRAMVAWLENTKVRGMKPEERQGLTSLESPTWDAALSGYLAHLECPIAFNSDNWDEVLLWLARHAVHLEYMDKADALAPGPPEDTKKAGAAQASQAKNPTSAQPKVKPPFDDCSSPEVAARVREMLAALNLETSQELTLPDLLQAVQAVLKEQILPFLNLQARRQQCGLSGSKQAAKSVVGSPSAIEALRELPLGFTTGVPALDDACRVLRLLHVKDLRHLQSSIDDAIVSVQEFVANPRTDSTLGKIGI